jgi:hypothetical protein
MKKTEYTDEFLNQCLDALTKSERLVLTEAELRFYTAIRAAVMAYEDEVRLGHPAPERRCMICKEPLSQCRC